MVGSSSGQIVLLGVFAHRAAGGKPGSQSRHALPDSHHPGGGYALFIAGIKIRYYLMLESLVQRLGLGGVPSGVFAVLLTVAQGPPDVRHIGFGPPAVYFREVEAAIDEHLHA